MKFTVVYFDQLSGACCTWKLVELLFVSHFQPFFFVDFQLFSVISRLKSTKNVWEWTKKCFFHILPALQSWSTCKSWLTPWGGPSNLSFFGWFFTFFNLFSQFSNNFTWTSNDDFLRIVIWLSSMSAAMSTGNTWYYHKDSVAYVTILNNGLI